MMPGAEPCTRARQGLLGLVPSTGARMILEISSVFCYADVKLDGILAKTTCRQQRHAGG